MEKKAPKTLLSRWFFPTNFHNVRLILSQGLLSGHDGFLEKYYRDLLELCPGRIPLFKNTIDEQSLQWVTSEAEHLQSCLIELDLSIVNLQSNSQVFKQGQWENCPFAEAVSDETVNILALPAPLPLTMIKKIIFESKEQLQDFQKDCESRGNIVLDKKILSFTKKDSALFQHENNGLFKNGEATSEQHAIVTPAPFDTSNSSNNWSSIASPKPINYHKAYAWGGMLTLLFYMAKNGSLSHDFYSHLCSEEPTHLPPQYAEVASLFSNVQASDKETDKEPSSEKEQINQEISKIVIHSKAIKDDLLAFFKDHPWQDDKIKDRAIQIHQMLQRFDSGSDIKKKPSDYFNKETFLGKNLLMLFYRESSEDWLTAERALPAEFDEQQLLGFAVLFGLRDKFTKVTPFLRRYNHLQNYMSVLMVRYAHNSIQSQLSFSEPVKKPETIWGLLQKKPSRKRLLVQLKLQNCVETRFSSNRFIVEGRNVTAPGIIEPDYRIIEANYYQEMQHKFIDDITYNKLPQ